ncbi:STE/STE7 protein kinase, variant [Sphaeroforma arctica JP610]|uniref:mitogen-activated protein kinase kinase n=1 Tax=Sphaeroforma arctica JP610 TaxID=667725 RepID=A0A0L0G1K6_9EUKA|nr:STE/STE7 protein kinase, variant [Sphaeroforma arctica JP610]KNC82719.1 STE/STE7 protein kinase, variant [Sphaeroforma arctica JP610]|eukprot:XP_014156621.1 STE/STE7 protein kinase, variant [Sphaeroforma arctica JP610]
MYRKKKNLTVAAPAEDQTSYSLSGGVFKEGDLSVGQDGLNIADHAAKLLAAVTELSLDEPADDDNEEFSIDLPNVQSDTSLGVVNPSEAVQLNDLQRLGVVGRGAGGVVQRALHVPTGRIFALKIIQLDVTPQVRKQILLELTTLYKAQSPYIVKFHGAFFSEGSISICLEYMEGGALSDLCQKSGRIPEKYLCHIAEQGLRGLQYMHKDRHLIHRDIKPSNLLLSSTGAVKISDFGVSGQLASTISSCVSWVGTVTYMSPERIQGKSYSVLSDIWSFGLSVMELALHAFPYPIKTEEGGLGFWELLDYIVDQPAPVLPASESFSPEFRDFLRLSLQKNPKNRPTASELLQHPWMQMHDTSDCNLFEWARHNVVEPVRN